MKRKEIPVFVLDIMGRPEFAFEAGSMAEAEQLVSAPSFSRALSDFLVTRHEVHAERACLRPRAANAIEASFYRDFACEFADASGDVLFAHLCDEAS